MADLLYKDNLLEFFCAKVLLDVGVSEFDAKLVSSCLIKANLCGIDTHGISRLPTYVRRISEGAINATAKPFEISSFGATSILNADNSLGPMGAIFGINRAIELANQYGVSFVNVINSNHFSYAGHYCEIAAEKGFIGICSSGGEPTIAPWGGSKPFFTNSPFAFGAPTKSNPLVVDFATSVSSRGAILLANILGKDIPDNWAIDNMGKSTTNPGSALLGSVLPLGGAKGYSFIVALEILNNILSGGSVSPNIGSQSSSDGKPAGVNHFFIAIKPDIFITKASYLSRIEGLINAVHMSPKADGIESIFLPGERRRLMYIERKASGIPLPQKILDQLNDMAKKYSPNAVGIL